MAATAEFRGVMQACYCNALAYAGTVLRLLAGVILNPQNFSPGSLSGQRIVV